ncbi:MAG: glycosyltransferase [Candidatus Bipolaricaulota bacterium]|nr:glycosyltransferase [Candidatus Bipolaricaulota bacterium]MDW8126199.1 glycosyltransferase [Candidatus Bipolaricaulota bacterium]
MPKLSIVIPTLNEEDYLPGLLESITSQAWKDYEIIVSDAGSSDDTVRIAEHYGAKVVVGPKRGPGYGRNRGAEMAQGELLLFLDADVRLPGKDFLRKAVEEFERRALGAAGFYIRAWDGHIGHRLLFLFGNALFWATQRIDPHVPGWAILVRKELHQKIGGFDETPAFREDHDYISRIRRHGKIGFLRVGPIFGSTRRFATEGTLRTLAIYLYTELARPFGRIPYDRFRYTFGWSKKKKG